MCEQFRRRRSQAQAGKECMDPHARANNTRLRVTRSNYLRPGYSNSGCALATEHARKCLCVQLGARLFFRSLPGDLLSKQKDQGNCKVIEEEDGGPRRQPAAKPRQSSEGLPVRCLGSPVLGNFGVAGQGGFYRAFEDRRPGGGLHAADDAGPGRTTFSFPDPDGGLLSVRGRRGVALRPRAILRCMALGIFGIAEPRIFFITLRHREDDRGDGHHPQYVAAPVLVLLYMLARGRQRATGFAILCVALAVTGSVLAIGVMAGKAGFPWLRGGNRAFEISGDGSAIGDAWLPRDLPSGISMAEAWSRRATAGG